MRNSNGKIIRKLSARSMRKSRMRNIIAVIAIALTSLLFTALFSMGMDIYQMIQDQTMEEVGTRAHAGLKDVTMEQYERITDNPLVTSSTWNIFLGVAENITKRQSEIRVAGNEEELENSFAALQEGTFPQNEDDLVTDTIVLEELGIPAEVGEKIHVEYTFHGEKISQDFRLCGWYEGSEVSHASTLYVSEAYWDSVRRNASWEELLQWDREHPENNHAGLVSGNIFFKNSRNIEENIRRIIEDAGYTPEGSEEENGEVISYGVNWAYMSSRAEGIDPVSAAILIAAFAVILITGYLIIYNIFQISIVSDIRFYGLLKTVGATKRQLQRLVYRQAFLLCIPGIPLGLLLGAGAGKLLLPLALRIMKDGHTGETGMNPWILVFGGAFSLLTVCISCRKPAKIAGNVSPVEAVRFSEGGSVRQKERKSQKGAGARRMALANLGRNRKKTAVVISSISLGIILLETVMSAVGSFQMDDYLQSRIAGDFEIGSASMFNTGSLVADFEIDGAYLAGADSQQGIRQTGEIWWGGFSWEELSDEAYARYKELLAEGKFRIEEYEEESGRPDMIAEYRLPVQEVRYAYTADMLENLTSVKGEIDLEKFAEGGYVLVQQQENTNRAEPGDTLYEPGDKITLQYTTPQSEYYEETDSNGNVSWGYTNTESREYTVMAVIEEIPYSMRAPFTNLNGLTTVVPLEDLKEAPSAEMIAKTYEVEEESQEAFENYLKAYTEQENTSMAYLSKPKLMEEFSDMIQSISVIGYTLCAVIALIGILNFANSMLTGVISRRQEFAVLQSVGMTKRQLRGMLLWESGYYLIICAAVSVTVGSLLSWKLVSALNGVILCFEYHYTALPYLIMLPAIAAAGTAVSLGAYRQAGKKSAVEYLREAQ